VSTLDPQSTHYPTPGPEDGTYRSSPGTGFAGTGASGAGFSPWSYRDEVSLAGADLVGYKVEATDGGIGKIDEATHEVGSAALVVDTGPWIFGKKVLLPAGTVSHVDHEDRKVYVDRSKDQIKDAPEFDPDNHTDPVYRDKLGSYYGDTYEQTDRTHVPSTQPRF